VKDNGLEKIRALLSEGKSCREIALLTGVSFSTISRIAREPGSASRRTIDLLNAWAEGADTMDERLYQQKYFNLLKRPLESWSSAELLKELGLRIAR